ncbi:fasciclin domain-containing protein [Skermanella aerolata]|nr:fasciclin domain-containing protein [Skermanella aerolata]KJB96842.1 fasciclin [Skermanella aerolata KACC 11604]
MNRLMLGAAAIALGVGTMGTVQAQTSTNTQQNLQPASCTQLDVGEVANRVDKLQAGTQKEQLEQLILRARDAATGGNVMQCRQLLVEAEAKLPGGAQTTKETPAPAFLGGPDNQNSSTARSANPEQAPIQADNLVAALRNNPQFSTLAKLIETAGLADTLSRSGQHTLFAPTNAAFEKLPQATLDQLGQEQHRDQLRAILAQHVVEGHSYASTQFPSDIKAMGGDPIDVSLTNGRPRLSIGEPQPQATPQSRTATATSTESAPAPAPTPSAANQDLTDALSALENANQALTGESQDNQPARDQLARARQAIDRGQLQTTDRQPLQQAGSAIDRATQALQNNDRAAARTAVSEALPPLRQAESATPSSANQTNTQTAGTTTGNSQRPADASPAAITVGDIRTGNGFVHGIDTVLIPEGVQEALVR